MINLGATIMEEGDRTMDQFPTGRHAMRVTDMADIQLNTQPPAEAASIELTEASPAQLSLRVRERDELPQNVMARTPHRS